MSQSEYDKQASEFLKRNALKMRITLSDSKPANWEPSGHHYRVTLSGAHRRMTFDFWGSAHDAETGEDPSPYDVLACISSDAYCPDTFQDFCEEYGYEEDSIKALQTFQRCERFSKRLNEFFTREEIEDLAEIQ